MLGREWEDAGVRSEKYHAAYRDDIEAPSHATSIDEWSQGESEKTGLLWTINKTPIRLGERASPRQNISAAKLIFIAIIVAFSILNFSQVCNTIHTRRRLRFEKQVEMRLDDEVPAKAVVMASFSTQNVSWAMEIPDDWRIYRYVMDDSTVVPSKPPAGHQLSHKDSLYKYTHTVPRNQGREAMAYLTFIIDNYDRLPLFTAFIHGHERGWHQVEPMQLRLQSLNLTTVVEDKFASFRCHEFSCSMAERLDATADPNEPKNFARPVLTAVPEFWRLIFPDEPLPTNLQSPMTAQFIVPRSVILSRPLEFWINLRHPITRDLPEYFAKIPHIHEGAMKRSPNWKIGLMYEHIWHVAFRQPNRWCPSTEYCRGTTFSNTITCNNYPINGAQDPDLKNTTCIVDDDAVARAARAQDDVVRMAKAELRREIMGG